MPKTPRRQASGSHYRNLAVALAGFSAVAVLLAAPGIAGASEFEEVDQPVDTAELVLVDDLSTRTTNTFVNPDGGYLLASYTAPVNFKDDSGTWQQIDNTFVAAPGSTYAVENAANDYSVSIPEDAGTTPVKFEVDGTWATMRLHGMDDRPVVDGPVATFTDISSAESVTYTATATGLKEDIVLAQPPSDSVAYKYTLATSSGLTPVLTEEGTINFVTAGGRIAFVMPVGNMVDSAVTPAYSGSVDFKLETAEADWTLTVTPDAGWLASPDRVYPVTVDPSLVNQPVSKDCWVSQDAPDTKYCGTSSAAGYVRVGLSDSSSKRRGLVNFDVSSIPTNANVSEASVTMTLDAASSTGSANADYAFFTAGKQWDDLATWNTAGTTGTWTGGSPGAVAYGTKNIPGGTSGPKTFTMMQDVIQGWVNGTITQRGLVLRQVGESAKKVLWFYSSSTTTGNQGPALTVDYQLPGTNAGDILDPSVDANNVYDPNDTPLEDVDTTSPVVDKDSVVISFSANPSVRASGEYMVSDSRSQSVGYDAAYVPAVWAACGAFDSQYKIARKFHRHWIVDQWVGYDAYLNCGKNGNFGVSHLFARNHDADFAKKAAMVGSLQWRHAAHFAMYGSLAYPQYAVDNTINSTTCMARMVYAYVGEEEVARWKAITVIGSTGRRIITAYPSKSWCSAGAGKLVVFNQRPS